MFFIYPFFLSFFHIMLNSLNFKQTKLLCSSIFQNEIFFLADICSLSKIEVRIPRYIQAGDTADLICSYYLDSHNLYSVKWYKGRHEFYRFMPNENPPVKIFPVKGMQINVS